jgi:hypothetical protein
LRPLCGRDKLSTVVDHQITKRCGALLLHQISLLLFHSGQGLRLESGTIGVSSTQQKLSSQYLAWDAEVKAAKATIDSMQTRAKKQGCNRPASKCSLKGSGHEDFASISVATSPAVYDVRNTSHTGGLMLGPTAQNQGVCQACVAYAIAAAAQSAAATALKVNTTDRSLPFPSVRQLYFCGYNEGSQGAPDCSSGWQLRPALQLLTGTTFSNGLAADECLRMPASMTAVENLNTMSQKGEALPTCIGVCAQCDVTLPVVSSKVQQQGCKHMHVTVTGGVNMSPDF